MDFLSDQVIVCVVYVMTPIEVMKYLLAIEIFISSMSKFAAAFAACSAF